MKVLIAAIITIVCVDDISGILRLYQGVPSDWPLSYRHGEYVKDRDDCRFGYRVNGNQVIHVLNCTNNDDPTVFYSLTSKTCNRATADETCDRTPLLNDDDNIVMPDPNCVNIRAQPRGVAPDPANCARWLQCGDDGQIRHGRKTCARGQYFSTESYRCEFMWREGANNTITSLTEEFMCGGRPIPVGRRRNHGVIMEKCKFSWSFVNYDTYSVSEPVDCQYYYLCFRYNPAFQDSSVVSRCPGENLYWSDSQQLCVLADELTVNNEINERQACSV